MVPVSLTSFAPFSTRETESAIRVSISFAAPALRLARLRTSPATTAKPRPCSPARAASTAALRARILVWKAMLLITVVISAIFFELPEIPSIVVITSFTSAPPLLAVTEATSASSLAWLALSAFSFTVAVNSSMLAAVSSSAAACSSVREERSLLPVEISVAPRQMFSLPWRILLTASRRLSCIANSSGITWPTQLRPISSSGWLRSPCAISLKCARIRFSGLTSMVTR